MTLQNLVIHCTVIIPAEETPGDPGDPDHFGEMAADALEDMFANAVVTYSAVLEDAPE